MKRVLIIANLFYASPRIPGLAKYLPEFGWQPIIITVPLGENPDSSFGPPNDFRKGNWVIETRGHASGKTVGTRVRKRLGRIKPLLRFFHRRYSEIAHYPDKEKHWMPLAMKAAEELLKNEDMDAMISSSSPVTCHLIARKIKNKYRIPWIADLRDLWTQNHNYPYSVFRRFFERRLETKTLSMADALVTISLPMANRLNLLHKGKPVYTITNGFDPEKMSTGEVDLTAKFTITYTGQIYEKQNTEKLLYALKDLISQGIIERENVEVRVFGPRSEKLEAQALKYGLTDIVKQYGIVSREISFLKQRESQLLLLLKWEDSRERGIYTGKAFEYLAAMRPILATGGTDDVVTELLHETKGGADAQTVEDVKNALRTFYNEFKLEGKISYQGKIDEINKYSYREIASKFAEILGTSIKND
jgi:glycosyltransferase involved in cell wall biosynthesis